MDAHTGAQVWSQQHGPGGCGVNNGTTPCYTTSSPAVDPNGQWVYSYGLDGRVHKHAVGTGTESTTGGWPELTTTKPFNEKGSSALSIATTAGGTYLYVANGGYIGDNGDYQGHVTTINLGTGAQNVFNTLCSNQPVHFAQRPASPDCPQVQSAVWSRPGVVYDPGTGRIFLSTGNGDFAPSAHDWGDSVLALNPDGTGSGGNPLDNYTPGNFASLQSSDLDLGSTAPTVIPGIGRYPHLAVQGGKDGILRVLDLASLSQQGGVGHNGGDVSHINLPQGGELLSQPAAWVDPNGHAWVFVGNDRGIAGIQVGLAGGNTPALFAKWQHGGGATSGITSPLVANGVLFWASQAGITAYDAATGTQLWQDPTIGGFHWESPVVANGAMYITDESGHLSAYVPHAGSGIPTRAAGRATDGTGWMTTGNDAAPPVFGGTWSSLNTGAIIGSAAAVSVPGSAGGVPYYVATGSDHNVYVRSESVSWRSLSPPGTNCTSSPAATSAYERASGQTLLVVACRGADGALWYVSGAVSANPSVLPSASGWKSLGGGMTTDGPAIAAIPPFTSVNNDLTFLVNGLDGQVWARTLSASWWQTPWGCTGHLGAAAVSSSIFQVFAFACQGNDGAVWMATDRGGSWNLFSLGGTVLDGPGIALGPDSITVVAEGRTDHQVYQDTSLTINPTSNVPFNGWAPAAGNVSNGATAAALLTQADSTP